MRVFHNLQNIYIQNQFILPVQLFLNNSLNIFLHFNTLRMKAPEMHNIDKKKVILLGAHLTLNFHLERT